MLHETSSLEVDMFFTLTLVEYPRNVPGDALVDKGDGIPVYGDVRGEVAYDDNRP